MEQPTTPQSRRELWSRDARALVEEFQAWSRGEGRESFPPWRIGYMAGLQDVKEAGNAYYTMTMHRIAPHKGRQQVVIPHVGRPGRELIDMLCWHYDQDVRRYELDHVDHLDPWFKFPSGPILVDPIMRSAMEACSMDEDRLACRIRDADGFGTKARVSIRMEGVGTVEVGVRYNEVHTRLTLPGTSDAIWSRGHLSIAADGIPETIATAARGRGLGELVDHPAIRACPGVTIRAVTRNAQGRYIIATDAASASGMVPAPTRKTALAA